MSNFLPHLAGPKATLTARVYFMQITEQTDSHFTPLARLSPPLLPALAPDLGPNIYPCSEWAQMQKSWRQIENCNTASHQIRKNYSDWVKMLAVSRADFTRRALLSSPSLSSPSPNSPKICSQVWINQKLKIFGLWLTLKAHGPPTSHFYPWIKMQTVQAQSNWSVRELSQGLMSKWDGIIEYNKHELIIHVSQGLTLSTESLVEFTMWRVKTLFSHWKYWVENEVMLRHDRCHIVMMSASQVSSVLVHIPAQTMDHTLPTKPYRYRAQSLTRDLIHRLRI